MRAASWCAGSSTSRPSRSCRVFRPRSAGQSRVVMAALLSDGDAQANESDDETRKVGKQSGGDGTVPFQAETRCECAFTYMNAVFRKNLTAARAQECERRAHRARHMRRIGGVAGICSPLKSPANRNQGRRVGPMTVKPTSVVAGRIGSELYSESEPPLCQIARAPNFEETGKLRPRGKRRGGPAQRISNWLDLRSNAAQFPQLPHRRGLTI
jgi:hypothetical protein